MLGCAVGTAEYVNRYMNRKIDEIIDGQAQRYSNIANSTAYFAILRLKCPE
jgi:hypothetical protein